VRFIWLLILLNLPLLSYSQEIVSSGGDQFYNSQGSFTFTVGEPVIETSFQINNILTQGFQQNYESLLSLQNLPSSSSISVYPNPFQEHVTIDFSDAGSSLVAVSLKSSDGKVLSSSTYALFGSTQPIEILFSNLAEGIYFLSLRFDNEQQETTFRIVKTQ
jgi:hypothetical protein